MVVAIVVGGGVVSWLFVFPSLVGGGGGDVLLL